jgi:16S rRNA (guanine527-N7)-methyltransferase
VTEDEAKAHIAARVSRETLERLEAYDGLLRKWQFKVNLVAKGTLDTLWTRHFLDSFQLLDLVPETHGLWLDIGSGGGFPGLVCAICAKDIAFDHHFQLLESDTRKCAFLREVARITNTKVDIRNTRIEAQPTANAAILSARALAPLPKLLAWVQHHLRPDGVCLLQKGAGHGLELESARADWQMDVEVLPSLTSQDSVILRIRNIRHA